MNHRVTIREGDIFESDAQTLVNTVNCVGVMGKGIALGFRKRFPEMHDDYVRRCERGEVKLGRPYLYKRSERPWILNFPTKDHWRSMSRLADIEEGLGYLEANYRDWGIESLAVPPLGSGHGGLEWQVVGPTLYHHLKRLDIPVELYVPFGTPHEELKPAHFQDSLMAEAAPAFSRIGPDWVALLTVLDRLEHQSYRPRIGRVSFQKLAYFATVEGFELGLSYSRGSYGPYAAELKNYVSHLLNNGLIQESRLGRMFEVRLGPTYEAARRSFAQELPRFEPQVERLVDLFARITTTKDAEIAAAVHFAAAELTAESGTHPSERQIVEAVLRWKQRRRPRLTESDVSQAVRGLNLLGWIDARPSEDLTADPELQAILG
jgi:O-acetyl-ADP-ribose deacetylase (regulator of RNase III)